MPGGDFQAELQGRLDERPIIDVIREIYGGRRTGVLGIERGESRRKFHFVGGELHLPGSHGLAKKLAEYLETEQVLRARREIDSGNQGPSEQGDAASAEARRELEKLVQRIVNVLVEWREGEFHFDRDPSAFSSDLVGPLPTAYLIMEGSVCGKEEAELLQQLGGEDALVVASGESELLTRLYGIDPEQMFLLSRAEEPITVGELLRQVSIDRHATLRKLCRLHAVELLQDLARKHSEAADKQEDRLIDSLVDRFSSRIASRLEAEPIPLETDEHRALLAKLLREVGDKNHYELLGVGVHASDEDIHMAYEELGRLVHPSHAPRIGLEGRDAGMRLLFERATVAYLTLGDPERRASYNVQAGVESSRAVSADVRTEEQAKLARESFEKATARLDVEDYHFALELVHQAVLADPRAEYYAMQAQIEARNPHWLDRATESYRHALRLDPGNADYRVGLAKVFEERGQIDSARLHFKVALKEMPTHEEAIAGMKRVGPGEARPSLLSSVASEGGSETSRGFFNRLKSLFGG